MNGRIPLLAAFAVLGLAPPNPGWASSSPTMAWSDVAARVVPATVNILISGVALEGGGATDGAQTAQAQSGNSSPGQRNQSFGSGFIINKFGIIVTNKHVVSNAVSITVTLQDGTTVPAAVVAKSALADIALLKIEAGHALPTLELGDGDAVRPGDPVLAIGNPLGVGTSLSAGIVSGTQRDLMNSPFDDYVQTDAAINHGNSGGPLVDSAGKVIGVNSELLTNNGNEGSNGLGFAISSNVLAAILDRLLRPVPNPVGWIGLHLQGLTPDLAASLKIPEGGIAIVTQIDSESPASEAGLEEGDVVLSFADKQFPNVRLLMRDIAVTPVGETRSLKVWSAGNVKTLELPIRDWPDAGAQAETLLDNPRCLPPPDHDLGLLLEPITPLDQQLYNLGSTSGLLVAAVNPTSEAYGLGFRPGIVIDRIGAQHVTTLDEARRALDDAAINASTVALLVKWANGPSWFTLHTAYGRGQQGPAVAELNAVCRGRATP